MPPRVYRLMMLRAYRDIIIALAEMRFRWRGGGGAMGYRSRATPDATILCCRRRRHGAFRPARPT